MLAFCPACALLQVTISADVLYRREYPYFSSSSPALLKHSAQHVEGLIRHYELGPGSFVVEVASTRWSTETAGQPGNSAGLPP
jgi:hypothetical protein